MRKKSLLIAIVAFFLLGNIDAQNNVKNNPNTSPEEMRSPENEVFQFMQSGTCTAWADSSKTNATLYLWIPENCKKLRGLVIMCTNVPEHMLVGHPAIRKACEANALGIIWSTPTFMNFKKSTTKDNKHLNTRPPMNFCNNYLTDWQKLQVIPKWLLFLGCQWANRGTY